VKKFTKLFHSFLWPTWNWIDDFLKSFCLLPHCSSFANSYDLF
jgi:hypothetical protein